MRSTVTVTYAGMHATTSTHYHTLTVYIGNKELLALYTINVVYNHVLANYQLSTDINQYELVSLLDGPAYNIML